jgi:hypothetical protein
MPMIVSRMKGFVKERNFVSGIIIIRFLSLYHFLIEKRIEIFNRGLTLIIINRRGR